MERYRKRTASYLALLVGAAVVIGLLTLVGISSERRDPDRPNIVLIQVDDLSMEVFRARIRVDGTSRPAMPTVRNDLAGEGVAFSRFYANNPICAPSRASLLSGLTTHNHEMLINAEPFGYEVWQDTERESENLATWLQDAGYRTAHIGKFMNGYDEASPTPPGWDEWVTSLNNAGAPYYGYSLSRNGAIVGPIGSWKRPDPATCRVEDPRLPGSCTHAIDVYTALAVEEVERASAEGSPFFLQVDYNAPHDDGFGRSGPEPPTRYRSLIRKASLAQFEDEATGNSTKPYFIRNLAPISDRLAASTRLRLRKEIVTMKAVDDSVGRILAVLRKTGELDRSFVIFLSDNGSFAGEHRIANGKYLPHEPSTRQPLLVRGPGIEAESRSRAVASTIDLAPTVMDLAGDSPGKQVDGISLVPAFRSSSFISGRAIPLEGFNGEGIDDQGPFEDGMGLNRPNQALVVNYTGFVAGRWKYIRYYYGDEELYDLKRDPQEYWNHAEDDSYTRVMTWARGLSKRLQDCSGQTCRPKVASPSAPSG